MFMEINIKSLTRGERIWIVSIIISFIAGLWVLWTRDFSKDVLIYHIKFFYSILLFVAISIAIYFVMNGPKTKNKQRRGDKR